MAWHGITRQGRWVPVALHCRGSTVPCCAVVVGWWLFASRRLECFISVVFWSRRGPHSMGGMEGSDDSEVGGSTVMKF